MRINDDVVGAILAGLHLVTAGGNHKAEDTINHKVGKYHIQLSRRSLRVDLLVLFLPKFVCRKYIIDLLKRESRPHATVLSIPATICTQVRPHESKTREA
jgi:hypothetical protein